MNKKQEIVTREDNKVELLLFTDTNTGERLAELSADGGLVMVSSIQVSYN